MLEPSAPADGRDAGTTPAGADGAPPPPLPPACRNCGTPLVGPYCSRCGQRAARRLVSVRRMTMEAVEDQLSVNATLPRTLRALLLRPGLLTREYADGRIARYLPPFRLYLVSSVLLFLALAWTTDVEAIRAGFERETAADTTKNIVIFGTGDVDVEEGDTAAAGASADSAGGGEPRRRIQIYGGDTTGTPGWLKPLVRRVERQEERLNSMRPGEALGLLISEFERQAPKAVFLLIPVFALMLKVLYLRRRRLYAEHFVFSLHVHSVTFLAFTAMLLLPGGLITSLLLLWLAIYYFLAMRRVYGQGVFKTTVKYLSLFFAYTVALGLVLAFALVFTTLTV